MKSFFVLLTTEFDEFRTGGKIYAEDLEQAQISAFFICKCLQKDGFEQVIDVSAVENANELPQKLIHFCDLSANLYYYMLEYTEKFGTFLLEPMLDHFEKKQEYEKCDYIVKKFPELLKMNV